MSKTAFACFVAWLIPGGGHMLLRKWGRGVLFFAVVVLLFYLGLAMHGALFGLTPGFFGLLKFVAEASIGLPYVVGKLLGWGQGDIHAYAYEYANTYLYVAGLLNMLMVLDTFDIAQRRRQ